MSDLTLCLPVNLMVFRGDDDIADVLLLGEVTDASERFEIAFDWGGKRYYVGMKKTDLIAALKSSP